MNQNNIIELSKLAKSFNKLSKRKQRKTRVSAERKFKYGGGIFNKEVILPTNLRFFFGAKELFGISDDEEIVSTYRVLSTTIVTYFNIILRLSDKKLKYYGQKYRTYCHGGKELNQSHTALAANSFFISCPEMFSSGFHNSLTP